MKINGKIIVSSLIICAVATGCAGNRDRIVQASHSVREYVFTENTAQNALSGKAVVDFTFSVKSNSYYLMGTYGKHTAPPYRVHLNINGQATVLEAEPALEDKSPVDSKVPESGIGWRYQFSKRIALVPGKHKLIIALPIDDVIVEREVEFSSGANSVTVMPIYSKRNLRPYKGENFTAGVRSLEISVD